MLKARREQTIDMRTSLKGMLLVVLMVLCFIIVLELVTVAVRALFG